MDHGLQLSVALRFVRLHLREMLSTSVGPFARPLKVQSCPEAFPEPRPFVEMVDRLEAPCNVRACECLLKLLATSPLE